MLRPGAHADLIAVEGDPTQALDALERVRCVVLGGRAQTTPGPAGAPGDAG